MIISNTKGGAILAVDALIDKGQVCSFGIRHFAEFTPFAKLF